MVSQGRVWTQGLPARSKQWMLQGEAADCTGEPECIPDPTSIVNFF